MRIAALLHMMTELRDPGPKLSIRYRETEADAAVDEDKAPHERSRTENRGEFETLHEVLHIRFAFVTSMVSFYAQMND
jgi:hypothetical protein